MDEVNFLQALMGSGPVGVFLCYLAYERRQDKADRKEAEALRLAHDERRLSCDLKIAAALAALALRITGQIDVEA
jgi:hypothetical protein